MAVFIALDNLSKDTPVKLEIDEVNKSKWSMYKVVLLDNCLAESNRIIFRSRIYIDRRVFRFAIYANILIFIYTISLLFSVVLIFLQLMSAVIGLIYMSFWLILNLQHVFVIFHTLPIVLKLPRIVTNKYYDTYEVEVCELTEEQRRIRDTGIGYRNVSPDYCALCAISEKGVLALQLSKVVSVVMICLTLTVMMGCIISLLVFATE